jgi:hypothetical protein
LKFFSPFLAKAVIGASSRQKVTSRAAKERTRMDVFIGKASNVCSDETGCGLSWAHFGALGLFSSARPE